MYTLSCQTHPDPDSKLDPEPDAVANAITYTEPDAISDFEPDPSLTPPLI